MMLLMCSLLCAEEPIQFSISEQKIVREIPRKTQDFAYNIPGKKETYIFNTEEEYYHDYQSAYFAITTKKAGWDCMRHYEILASGSIPYFIDLESCDENTLKFFPKELILEAMHLEGVSYLSIDHARFDKKRYYEILTELMAYTRNHLTTKAMANYLLEKMHYSGGGKILFLSDHIYPDYLRDSILIGLKELLQEKAVDVPKIPHIYTSYTKDVGKLYGKGFSYTKIVRDFLVDRERIKTKIRAKEFELIIYGSVHGGTPFLKLVQATYDKDQIAYLCGEDEHICEHLGLHNLFIREFKPGWLPIRPKD